MVDYLSLSSLNWSSAGQIFAYLKFCSILGLFCSSQASDLVRLWWLRTMILFLSLCVLAYFMCWQLACWWSNWEHCSGLCYQHLVSYAWGDSGLGQAQVASYLESSQEYCCQRTFWYYSSGLWKFQASLSKSWSCHCVYLAGIDHLCLPD